MKLLVISDSRHRAQQIINNIHPGLRFFMAMDEDSQPRAEGWADPIAPHGFYSLIIIDIADPRFDFDSREELMREWGPNCAEMWIRGLPNS